MRHNRTDLARADLTPLRKATSFPSLQAYELPPIPRLRAHQLPQLTRFLAYKLTSFPTSELRAPARQPLAQLLAGAVQTRFDSLSGCAHDCGDLRV